MHCLHTDNVARLPAALTECCAMPAGCVICRKINLSSRLSNSPAPSQQPRYPARDAASSRQLQHSGRLHPCQYAPSEAAAAPSAPSAGPEQIQDKFISKMVALARQAHGRSGSATSVSLLASCPLTPSRPCFHMACQLHAGLMNDAHH